ncbi:hypothetical protein J2TS6_30890 [Paenibacillus albilobatus]|uniref:Uncharacterized protein n=1 Tax=Paenibacillus albilobatus TaxID=2716884 RepID=A0A920CBI8_9BACL|nr:hypothetical protein J2TS6_30890 [Paenibacillus albilobatus]
MQLRIRDIQHPGLHQQLGFDLILKLIPQPVGTNGKLRIYRVAAVGMADQPRFPMMAAFAVRRVEGVAQQRPHAPPGEMISGAHAHGTRSDDDDIVAFDRCYRRSPPVGRSRSKACSASSVKKRMLTGIAASSSVKAG